MDSEQVWRPEELIDANSAAVAIVTPSYENDYALCKELSQSVRRWAGPGIHHHVIVPTADLELFSQLSSSGTTVHDVREFLTPALRKVPGANLWLNFRRPWPPVRGWIIQQLVKLAAAEILPGSAILLADSDLVFVAPVEVSTLLPFGKPALYRRSGAVHAGLPMHRKWHESSRRLLGLPSPGPEDLTDYVCWPCIWDSLTVREALNRIERVCGRPWQTAIAGELFFSEMMLYGVFAESFKAERPTTSEMLAVAYSDEAPLSRASMDRILYSAPDHTIAVMISAKSATDLAVRKGAIDDFVAGRLASKDEP